MPVTAADQAMLDASPAPAVAAPLPVAAAPVLAPIPAPALPPGAEGPPAPPTPVDMPVALPAVAPAAASPAPTAPVPPELQGLADATRAQQDAAASEGDARAAQSDQNAQALEDARVQEQAQAQEAADLRAEHSRAAQRASEQTQRALIDARDAKIPDFWAGREGARTNAALWAGLGGAAAGLLGSSKNGAADIIQSNVDGYYARQKERIDNLFKYAKGVGEQEDNVRLRQAAELAVLQVQHGATNLAIADHIKQIAAASQGRVDIAAAQSLQADLAEKGQAAILAGRETLARIGLQGAQAARAAAKARGAAGGGAGRGSATEGIIALTKAIEDGVTLPDGTRRPLTQSEMEKAALDNKVPLNGKAGVTSLATISKDAAFNKNQAAKEGGAGAKANKEVAAFVQKQLAGDKELAEETKANSELRGALGLLKPGPDGLVNGVNFQQAIDKTVKAATGLGARKSSVDIFKGSLGGLWDKVERYVQNGETGQYTAHDTQVLTEALKKQLKVSAENAAGIRARHTGAFEANPITKGHADVYGSMLDEKLGKEASHPSSQPIGSTKVVNGKTYKKAGENNWQLVTP